MWRAVAVVLVVASASGCRQPYQGEATLIGQGTYAIRAAGEPGIAFEYAMRLAREVCRRSFEVFDEDEAARRAWKKLRREDTVELSLVVRCDPPGGSMAPQPTTAHDPHDAAGQ